MTVAFLDVDQGDATLIRDGNGFDVLVDGGRKGASNYLIEYLKGVGVDDLEIVVATHADRDHIGGLIELIQGNEIQIESVYYNGYPGTTQTWIEFSDAVSTAGISLIQAQYPDYYTWGAITAQVLNPVEAMVNPGQNEASVVLRIDYEQSSVILTADIDSSVEAELPNRAITLEADILKVAHHGSKHSTSMAFLGNVQPQEAIISAGPNSYDHPSIETINRLNDVGAGIWRTDAIGTILLSTDGDSIELLPKLAFLPYATGSFQYPKVIE
jgi:beta-lactamase superfamily II metal-dependent hydrolase